MRTESPEWSCVYGSPWHTDGSASREGVAPPRQWGWGAELRPRCQAQCSEAKKWEGQGTRTDPGDTEVTGHCDRNELGWSLSAEVLEWLPGAGETVTQLQVHRVPFTNLLSLEQRDGAWRAVHGARHVDTTAADREPVTACATSWAAVGSELGTMGNRVFPPATSGGALPGEEEMPG